MRHDTGKVLSPPQEGATPRPRLALPSGTCLPVTATAACHRRGDRGREAVLLLWDLQAVPWHLGRGHGHPTGPSPATPASGGPSTQSALPSPCQELLLSQLFALLHPLPAQGTVFFLSLFKKYYFFNGKKNVGHSSEAGPGSRRHLSPWWR